MHRNDHIKTSDCGEKCDSTCKLNHKGLHKEFEKVPKPMKDTP